MIQSLSVIIPVYNAAESIGELVRQLHELLPTLAEQYEVILAEDNSRDESWAVITGLAAEYPDTLHAYRMMRNFGQHNALLAGIKTARGEIIVTMDDDLQHPPDQIPLLLAALDDQQADVVYGKPKNERHGLFRDLASQVTKLVLQNAMGAETARNISAFRAFRRIVTRAFEHFTGPSVNLDVLLTWGTTRFAAVTVRHEPRKYGRSNYTFLKLVRHTLNMVTGFSTLPLRLASVTGFVMTVFGLVVLIYVLGRYLIEGGSVPGFPFLASIVAVFGGAQLFAIGIIGEYLARMYFRSMGRPPYVVREELPLTPQSPLPQGERGSQAGDGDDVGTVYKASSEALTPKPSPSGRGGMNADVETSYIPPDLRPAEEQSNTDVKSPSSTAGERDLGGEG